MSTRHTCSVLTYLYDSEAEAFEKRLETETFDTETRDFHFMEACTSSASWKNGGGHHAYFHA